MVPLFIESWGVDKYADWIVITAVGACFSFLDLGFVTAATNQLSALKKNTQIEQRQELFNSVLLSLYVIILLYSFVLCIWLIYVDNIDELGIKQFTRLEFNVLMFGLFAQTMIGFIGLHVDSIFRLNDLFYLTQRISNINKLVDGILLGLMLMFNLSITVYVVLLVVFKAIFSCTKYIKARTLERIIISTNKFSIESLKSLIKPSLTYLLVPLGNTILIQGLTINVNSILGSNATVVYTTSRTLVNTSRTLLTIVYHSSWPKFSLLVGRDDTTELKKMISKHWSLSVVVILVSTIVLGLFGPLIYSFWLSNEINLNYELFYGLLIVSLLSGVWFSFSVILIAQNRHARFNIFFFSCTFLVFFTTRLLTPLTGDLIIIPLVLLIMDLFLISVVLKEVSIATNQSIKSLVVTLKI